MRLALETSTPHASLALWDPDRETLVDTVSFESHRAHNSAIFAPLQEMIQRATLPWADLSEILVGTGPGSDGGGACGNLSGTGSFPRP
ncbi:MAG: hypothetical protein AAGJ31_16295 [Verrucomicrobiota bacterium]